MLFAEVNTSVSGSEPEKTTIMEDRQADAKEESQADVKEDSQADVKEDSEAAVKEDSQAAVKEDSEAAVKEDGEDKNLAEKHTELLPVKISLKSRPGALGLMRLRRMGRTENYKGSDQDNNECLNPFMQGMPFGDKEPLAR